MARSNYSFQKRQKELERKKKKEEKRNRKLAKNKPLEDDPSGQAPDEEETS